MNLTIDIGNTLTKVALFEKDEMTEIRSLSRFSSHLLQTIFDKYPIKHAIVSSVAHFDNSLKEILKQSNFYMELTEHSPLPIKNCYRSSATLGRDRLAAVAGAHALYPEKNVLVIDIGTCVTYDFINERGEFPGGAISPGLDIRFKSLKEFTHNLPVVEKQLIDYFIGSTTKESMLSGVINGMKNEVAGFIHKYEDEFPNLIVLLTGGDAHFFESRGKSNIFAVPNLVMLGLNKILQYNAA